MVDQDLLFRRIIYFSRSELEFFVPAYYIKTVGSEA